jgi:glycosyltransferase involved in cell wall biosynthesis
MNEQSGISVVIPIYNEEGGLTEGIAKIKKVFASLALPFEIIAVNDGSTDNTAQKLTEIADIKTLHHHSNRGYGASLKTGILAAAYPYILITDADGTYPAESIPELVKDLPEYDMVVGARTGGEVHRSLLKHWAKMPVNWLANYLVNYKIPDLNSGLRVFNKELAKKYFKILPNGFSFTTNITLAFLSDGYRVKYLPINYYKRVGSSKVKPFSDALNYLTLVIRMILFYNPLKIFIPVAGIFLLASAGTLLYDIFRLDNITEKSIIFFTAFVQVAILGLLADLINKRTTD